MFPSQGPILSLLGPWPWCTEAVHLEFFTTLRFIICLILDVILLIVFPSPHVKDLIMVMPIEGQGYYYFTYYQQWGLYWLHTGEHYNQKYHTPKVCFLGPFLVLNASYVP